MTPIFGASLRLYSIAYDPVLHTNFPILFWVFGISVAVTKTPETFGIFEIKFRKTTEGTEGAKDENNNSL